MLIIEELARFPVLYYNGHIGMRFGKKYSDTLSISCDIET